MAVSLRLQVTRSADDRLSGTVHMTSRPDVRAFSGTLELLRVFEEFAPARAGAAELGGSGLAEGTPASTTNTTPHTQE